MDHRELTHLCHKTEQDQRETELPSFEEGTEGEVKMRNNEAPGSNCLPATHERR